MPFDFPNIEPWPMVSSSEWNSWSWQFKNSLKTQEQFAAHFSLSAEEEKGFEKLKSLFRSQTTPYYASLADRENPKCAVRRMLMPHSKEASSLGQQELDPLGERKPSNKAAARLVHRYSDRVLFLLTDLCSVYCRYCTRKHFTAQDQAFLKSSEYKEALSYIQSHSGVREVILSGGDPLTLSNSLLDRVLFDLRKISHIEVIRVHSRMPVVSPMRVDEDLARLLRAYKPVYLITHFNHPKEITQSSVEAMDQLVDHGVPVLNQMVLLNGVNNHSALVQALSRRLLYLRVKPYYMFQCDPSRGSNHFRTNVSESLKIYQELWGHLSGLAMPTYILDLPQGGGKVPLNHYSDLQTDKEAIQLTGWDGVTASYENPDHLELPEVDSEYLLEWEKLQGAKTC